MLATSSPTPEPTGTSSLTARIDRLTEVSPWAAVAARLQSVTAGEFEILTELGRGGMAAVYLARDLALNRRVAIKVMAPGLLLGPGMVERFRQEAVTVANLQHAHIIAIHAVRQVEDLHFFVMQFVPGRTLEGVLREHGALPIPVVLAWLYQIGSALGYAHRRGVIHRDIKPGNILLNADGEAVVTDFGIAKVAESPSHTQTGTVVGTPVYMSPEQCYAKELTGASDQYSLGIVGYEMLAGRPPFSGSSFALMRAHTDDPPPPLHEARPDVPPAVEAALMRMLAKRPDQRFPSLAEALTALGAAPLAPADPLHATLQSLAAASERLELLGDVLRTPPSPVPKTRERPKPEPASVPRTPVPTIDVPVVAVAPSPTDLEPGASATLRATVKTATGQPLSAADLTWESSAPGVVTVDTATGVLTAVAPGRAVISAVAGGARDSVDVVVGHPTAAKVEVSAPRGAVVVGASITVSAVVTSRFGVPVVTPVTWSVDDPDVAAIIDDPSHRDSLRATLRAVAPGTTGIIASCAAVAGRATLRVVAAPAVAPPSAPRRHAPPQVVPPPVSATALLPSAGAEPGSAVATPPADAGNAFHGPPAVAPPAAPAPRSPKPVPPPAAPARKRGAAWRWAVPAVVGVGALGYVVAQQVTADRNGTGADSSIVRIDSTRVVGDTTATGTSGDSIGAPRDTTAVVGPPTDTAARASESKETPPPTRVARRIELRPGPADTLAPGQTLTLTAVVRDARGAAMNDAPVRWSSSDSRVAAVDSIRGVVRAVSAGSARISARSGGVAASMSILVTPPAPDPTIVASVELGEIRQMTVGESTQLSVTARNAAGALVPGASIEWSSSNPDVASVGPGGLLNARAPGTSTIRASSGGRSAQRVVAVRPRDVPPPKNDSPAPPVAKTEAELRAEIQSVLATFIRGIETRDTAMIHRVFPSAGSDYLRRWQGTFADARDNIRMTGGPFQITGTPRDAEGSQVRVQAKFTAQLYSRQDRRELSFEVPLTAVVRRDSAGWRIVSIQ